MSKRPSHRAQWTESEVEQLRKGFAAGIPARDLARALGRTEEAVRRKHRLLGDDPKGGGNAGYFEGRAAEERERADLSDDPAVAAVHEKMASYYEQVVAGERDPISKEVK